MASRLTEAAAERGGGNRTMRTGRRRPAAHKVQSRARTRIDVPFGASSHRFIDFAQCAASLLECRPAKAPHCPQRPIAARVLVAPAAPKDAFHGQPLLQTVARCVSRGRRGIACRPPAAADRPAAWPDSHSEPACLQQSMEALGAAGRQSPAPLYKEWLNTPTPKVAGR